MISYQLKHNSCVQVHATMSVNEDEGNLVTTYQSSPRAARHTLPQQETQFGMEPDEETRRSSAPSAATITYNDNSTRQTVKNTDEVTRLQSPAQQSTIYPIENVRQEMTREDKARVELVSKQSRPFLLFKIVEVFFASVIIPLNAFTWPVMLLRGNLHLAMLTMTACVTFLLYCPVVFFGYLAHLNTPASVMLAMDLLGAVYFTVCAVMTGVSWADLEWLLSQVHANDPPVIEIEQIKAILMAIGIEPDLHLTADKLLMQCLLCCSAATMFIGDVFLTLKYLVFRRIPLIHKHRTLI